MTLENQVDYSITTVNPTKWSGFTLTIRVKPRGEEAFVEITNATRRRMVSIARDLLDSELLLDEEW